MDEEANDTEEDGDNGVNQAEDSKICDETVDDGVPGCGVSCISPLGPLRRLNNCRWIT